MFSLCLLYSSVGCLRVPRTNDIVLDYDLTQSNPRYTYQDVDMRQMGDEGCAYPLSLQLNSFEIIAHNLFFTVLRRSLDDTRVCPCILHSTTCVVIDFVFSVSPSLDEDKAQAKLWHNFPSS